MVFKTRVPHKCYKTVTIKITKKIAIVYFIHTRDLVHPKFKGALCTPHDLLDSE